jgi:hypothetical protein
MQPHAAVAALLLAVLGAGGCLRAHDGRVGSAPAEAAPERTAAAEMDAAAEERPGDAYPPASAPPAGVDFASQVQPILAARCQPCHFTGGKMYEKLPFDDPATIRHLGERLFTRIRAAEEQALIRAFLAEAAAAGTDPDAERQQ